MRPSLRPLVFCCASAASSCSCVISSCRDEQVAEADFFGRCQGARVEGGGWRGFLSRCGARRCAELAAGPVPVPAFSAPRSDAAKTKRRGIAPAPLRSAAPPLARRTPRSAQQLQHLLRQLVGLRDHRRAGLLQHLGARQVRRLLRRSRRPGCGCARPTGSRPSSAGSRSSTRSGSGSRRATRGCELTVVSAASTDGQRGVGAGDRRDVDRADRGAGRGDRGRAGEAAGLREDDAAADAGRRHVADVDRAAGRRRRRRGRSRRRVEPVKPCRRRSES